MMFPLDFWDLSSFFAFMALILIVTYGLLSQNQGEAKVLINLKRLERIAIVFSLLFLATVIFRLLLSFF
ncbi:MAG: hypothetical protein JXA91_08295 [Candidatus Thermoplasmatota archaeon]|nr:hypothetical protein [Candidatus Thermoplasmatota archaeon]